MSIDRRLGLISLRLRKLYNFSPAPRSRALQSIERSQFGEASPGYLRLVRFNQDGSVRHVHDFERKCYHDFERAPGFLGDDFKCKKCGYETDSWEINCAHAYDCSCKICENKRLDHE